MPINESKKRWVLARSDAAIVSNLARELNLSEFSATLLANRGLTDVEAAYKFLHPQLGDLHDPFLMCDMRVAVDRIMQAIARKEKILIYGDYDVDGTTSTVILKRALTILGADVSYYIPERLKDGYGLRDDAMDMAHKQGFHLIISVDTGIRAQQAVERARALGLDIIITDHHLPDTGLPRANAVLNPKRPDCQYPNKNLAGCGIAFKLAQALLTEGGRPQLVESFMKIAAIGTIADIVPLTGENRVIAKFGLDGLQRPRNPGLSALLEVCGVAGKPVSGSDVGFRIGPRINAVGRMAGASAAVDLFDAPDLETAMRMALAMDSQNTVRQATEAEILAQALGQIEASEADSGCVAVIAGNGWHRGVIGIVASKVVDRLHRPTVIISVENGVGHGSGRSIPPFHLLDGLTTCADLFERFGGHSHAAGLALRAENIPEFRRRLNAHARATLTDDDLIPTIATDYRLRLELAAPSTLGEIARFEPFGPGNPEPLFETHGAEVATPPRVIKEKHLKFQVRQSGRWLDCIWWNAAERAKDLLPGAQVGLAFTLSENTYNDDSQVQLVLRDLRAE